MKVKNDGGTRAVQNFGLVNAGEIVDVSDDVGRMLAAIPGFQVVTDESEDVDALICDVCDNEYSSRSSLNRHRKSHTEEE